ncbi:MAG: hypothetical protein BroJett039_11310 [Chloroflexota bacterium]|nr:MAG: hypothetical protein BroJett039_11310 [Chloroflexota bacterium]
MRSAVSDRLIADVPLGAFLSGGVDSTLIVALMAELSDQRVATFSAGFKDRAHDELPYARQVAQAYGTNHHEFVLEPEGVDLLPNLVSQFGEPFADAAAIPMFLLSHIARKHVTVALTGDGGDECFAGYPPIVAAAMAQQFHHLPGMAGGQIAAVLRNLGRNVPQRIRAMRWIVEMAVGTSGTYIFDPVGHSSFRGQNKAVYGPALLNDNNTDQDALYHEHWLVTRELDWADRALYVDMMTLLPNDFLVKTDVSMMAYSMEGRSPFLDLRLIELTCKIPSRQKIKGWNTKFLLKKMAERYIPREWLIRPKHGFLVPTSQWLRQDLAKLLLPILLSPGAAKRGLTSQNFVSRLIHEHKTGQADHGQRLWSLMILELWMMMFVDKTLTSGDSLDQFI